MITPTKMRGAVKTMLSEISTHLFRGKTGKDEALEDILAYWGAWRAEALPGLTYGSVTPIAVAMDMHKTDKMAKYLKHIPQPKQTRSIRPIIPNYYTHYRPVKVNQAVFEIQSQYAEILIRIYEDGWTKQDFLKNRNWTTNTYYSRICDAKRAIRKHPVIKRILAKC